MTDAAKKKKKKKNIKINYIINKLSIQANASSL